LESWALGRPWWLPPEQYDYPAAYRLVPTINFCVSLLQSQVSKLPLNFYRQTSPTADPIKIERQDGTISQLWATANTEETGYELTEQLVGSLLLQGNAYLFKDYLGMALPQQFWILPPTTVSPVPGPNRTTAYYEVKDGSRSIEVPRQQIVHFKLYDPDHKIVGASVMQSLRLSYETQRDSQRWMRKFYEKGGSVAGHYSTETALEREDIERLKKDIKKRFSGVDNAWEPVVLPSSLKYVRAGLTVAEMQFMENHDLTTKDILMAFKVPGPYANIIEGTGLNSDVMRVVRLMLHENAVEPLCIRIQTTLNELMLNTGEFGNGISCQFDFSGVLAVQEVFLDQAKAYQAATGAPVMSRAEARVKLGLVDLDDPGLEDLLVPINMVTADEAGQPEPVAPSSTVQAQSRSRRTLRDQLRRRADRTLRKHERLMRAGYIKMFRGQEERVKSELKAQAAGMAASRAIDPEHLLDDDNQDIKLIRKYIRAIVQDRGEEAIAEVAQELAFDLAAQDVQAWIDSKAFLSVTNINSTTRRRLQESIAEGVREQETLGELTARVVDVFGGRRANSLTIARTETAGAYNYASMEAWDQSGAVEMKEWLTAHDELVRDTHTAAEAFGPIPLDDRFEVGKDLLMFPGDPEGSVGEIANCRCTLVPVISEARKRGLESGAGDGRLSPGSDHAVDGEAPHKNGSTSLEVMFK